MVLSVQSSIVKFVGTVAMEVCAEADTSFQGLTLSSRSGQSTILWTPRGHCKRAAAESLQRARAVDGLGCNLSSESFALRVLDVRSLQNFSASKHGCPAEDHPFILKLVRTFKDSRP